MLVTGIILFSIMSMIIISGKLGYIDSSILLWFRNSANPSIPIGPVWLLDFMMDITALGSVTIIFIVTIIASGLFIIKKEYLFLRFILLSVIGGGIIDLILKLVFARPRPQIVPHLVSVDSLSYPSGHSVMSMMVYISLIFIIFYLDINKNIKLFLLYSAVVLIFLIGISRMYLGVHYPSDILGGWSLGLIWCSISIKLSNNLNIAKTAKRH
jgi:undecaprenyl-diphosphatase